MSIDIGEEESSFTKNSSHVMRVDFYEVGGKLYFGEMTFTSNKGRMQNYTQEYLRLLGDKVKLPKKRCPFK